MLEETPKKNIILIVTSVVVAFVLFFIIVFTINFVSSFKNKKPAEKADEPLVISPLPTPTQEPESPTPSPENEPTPTKAPTPTKPVIKILPTSTPTPTISPTPLPTSTNTPIPTPSLAPTSVTLTPTTVTFSDTAINGTNSKTLEVKNTGSYLANISTETGMISGPNSADFTVTTNGCGSYVSTGLPVGTTCTLTIQFKPSAAGTRTAQIKIAGSNISASPLYVTLSGNGL